MKQLVSSLTFALTTARLHALRKTAKMRSSGFWPAPFARHQSLKKQRTTCPVPRLSGLPSRNMRQAMHRFHSGSPTVSLSAKRRHLHQEAGNSQASQALPLLFYAGSARTLQECRVERAAIKDTVPIPCHDPSPIKSP